MVIKKQNGGWWLPGTCVGEKTNDNLGHEVGDYLITVFAKTIFNLSETHRFAFILAFSFSPDTGR